MTCVTVVMSPVKVEQQSLWAFKPCSHRASALSLALRILNRSRTHLSFDTGVNTDADT